MDVSEKYHIEKIERLIRQHIERLPLPESIEQFETPKPEFQDQMREIDRQKRLENPEFKGAFHEKKFKPAVSKSKGPSKGASKKSAKKFKTTYKKK
jgi:ATP-dependent RNA helicase RhlE